MKFQIVFKKSTKLVAEIKGEIDVDPKHLSLDDERRLNECEGLLERVLGLRVHIQEQ